MSEYYDASQAAHTPPPESPDLTSLGEEAMERELLEFLEDLEEQLTVLDEADAEEEEVSPVQVAAFEAVCGADDAPLALKSIKDRVDSGTTTWDEVSRNLEHYGQAGLDLMGAALKWMLAEAPRLEAEWLEKAEAAEQAKAEEPAPGTGSRNNWDPGSPYGGRPPGPTGR